MNAAGYPVSDGQRDMLSAYAELLLEWNGRVNLVSRKDGEQLWRNHILHALAVLLPCDLPREGRMLDLGTGGGLPGIPLAIMLPQVEFTLVDSIAKKIHAVGDIADRLGLRNVTVHRGRAEEQSLLRHCGKRIDIVLARAVTQLPVLVRWSFPLLRAQGPRRLIVWKGGPLAAEITEARRHPKVRDISEYALHMPGEPWFESQEKKIIEVEFE